jgi:ribosomal-protein-serine acetyltransferase
MPPLPMTITTPRLVLRRWEDADAPALVDVVAENIEHLRPWMPWIAFEPQTIEQRIALFHEWRAAAEAGDDTVYGVFLHGHPIGGTGLHRRRGPGMLEIGYWIDHRHTGKGYATELARALTDVALGQSGIVAVQIHHDRANTASGAVPRRLGYRLVIERRRPPQAPGETGMEWGWRMDRETWSESTP